ncbi:MAG: hypothetical protein Q4E61_02840 [Alphaproteobacteria bacterium]|nr:hypothetical protein [Alphaproteobacteria bacterium]
MCDFCECESKLESVAKKWLISDEEVDIGILDNLDIGLVISPKYKELSYCLNYAEYVKRIQIKYCPMCGREL